jgi:hypothetical protein
MTPRPDIRVIGTRLVRAIYEERPLGSQQPPMAQRHGVPRWWAAARPAALAALREVRDARGGAAPDYALVRRRSSRPRRARAWMTARSRGLPGASVSGYSSMIIER